MNKLNNEKTTIDYISGLWNEFITDIAFETTNEKPDTLKRCEIIGSIQEEIKSGNRFAKLCDAVFEYDETKRAFNFRHSSYDVTTFGLDKKWQKKFSGVGFFECVPFMIAFGKLGKLIKEKESSLGKGILFGGINTRKGAISNSFLCMILIPKTDKFWLLEYNTCHRHTFSVFKGVITRHREGIISDDFASGLVESSEMNEIADPLKWLKTKQDRATKILKYAERKIDSSQNRETPFNILVPLDQNLGHQLWYNYGGAILACSKLAAQAKDFQIYYDPRTNYFPVEFLGSLYGCKTKTYGNELEIFEGPGICLNSRIPRYDFMRRLIEKKTNKQKPKKSTTDKTIRSLIFAIKCGNQAFASTQFPVEEAIAITIATILKLNKKSPNTYQFIIDGMTTPYIPEGEKNPEDEPEQRKHFRESEEHWFQKLREQVPGVQITFMNGLSLVEKHPYYQAASKFIRFGDGSYHMAWRAVKESKPSNQLALLINNTRRNKEKLMSKKPRYVTFLEHTNRELSADNIIKFAETHIEIPGQQEKSKEVNKPY